MSAKNGSIWTNLKSPFFLGMSEEKIKIKAGRQLFFLVGDNFFMSEDSLTVKHSESGLIGKETVLTCLNYKHF